MKPVVAAVVVCLAMASPSLGVEVALLGPETFTRAQGKPTTQTRSFFAEAGIAQVELDNSVLGATRANGGTISVNGTPVFTNSDFGSGAPVLTRDAAVVGGVNTLSVELRGLPGSSVSLSITQEEEPASCPPGIVQCQVITPNPVTQTVAPGAAFSIDLDYSATSAGVAGVGVRAFYDSTELTFTGRSNTFALGFIGFLQSEDTSDLDGDPRTDRSLTMGWVVTDPPDSFPGTLHRKLMTLAFVAGAEFSGEAHINITGTPSFGYTFVSEQAAIFSTNVCPPGIVNCQLLLPAPTWKTVVPGSTFDLHLDYRSSSAGVPGVGVRLFFDSSVLTFDGRSNTFLFGFTGATSDVPDLADLDGDPSTDRFMTLAWVVSDPPSFWPGTTQQRLVTLSFEASAGFTGSTHLNVTSAGTAAGYVFLSEPATLLAAP